MNDILVGGIATASITAGLFFFRFFREIVFSNSYSEERARQRTYATRNRSY